MKKHSSISYVLGSRALLAGSIAAAIGVACGGSPSETTAATSNELGTCGPGELPTPSGGCTQCTLNTQGSATSAYLSDLFQTLRTDAASVQVTNGVESFIPPPSVLPGINFPTPPTKQVSVGSFSGSFSIWPTTAGYTVTVTNIPQLSITWPAWTAGASGVTIQATVQGTLDTYVVVSDAATISVTPTISLNGLPVTITFGTDGNGNATLPTSGVTLGSLSQYVSVNGCGAFGWCNGLASSMVDNSGSKLQSFIASQFQSALNGSGPFWASLMTALADAGELTDPSGRKLPAKGTSSPAGTVSSWKFDSMQGYANSVLTANFTGAGICYVDCTPQSAAQACAAVQCGSADDGCGDTIDCNKSCPTGFFCDGNTCVVPGGCDPACPSGYLCNYGTNGAPGVCVKNERCPVGYHFCNNACVPGTGLCP